MESRDKGAQPQPTLETTVQKEYTLIQEISQAIWGYGIPIIGGLGGFAVTHGPGGAGAGMALTSALLRDYFEVRCPPMINRAYHASFAVGASTTAISLLYNIFHGTS